MPDLRHLPELSDPDSSSFTKASKKASIPCSSCRGVHRTFLYTGEFSARRIRQRRHHAQTTLTAACSDCAFVWRGSNESNPEQTTLSAACSDFAQLRRCSKESNHAQTTLPSNLSEQVHSLSKQQLAWSARGSTPSNISEPVQSLSKQQKERSDRGSSHLNYCTA